MLPPSRTAEAGRRIEPGAKRRTPIVRVEARQRRCAHCSRAARIASSTRCRCSRTRPARSISGLCRTRTGHRHRPRAGRAARSALGPVAAGDTVRWIIGDTVSGSGEQRSRSTSWSSRPGPDHRDQPRRQHGPPHLPSWNCAPTERTLHAVRVLALSAGSRGQARCAP